MSIDVVRLSAERFEATLLSCSTGSLIELEYDGGYYCGKLVRVDVRSIVVAPKGRMRTADACAPMQPRAVFGPPLPLACVIGFEARGQRFVRD